MVKKMVCTLLAAVLCLGCTCAFAELRQSSWLDTALSMLEEGNPFLEQYIQLTDSDTKALFPLGIPYFYGGQNETPIFAKYPEYTTRKAWQDSKYYHKDTNYIYGFDCVGYTQWIYRRVLGEEHSRLSDLMFKENFNHIYDTEDGLVLPAWDKIAAKLRYGDLFVMIHGSYHVSMYIGTLRDYGFDEGWAELAPYLDNPLVIHCSEHPDYPQRFQDLIYNGLRKYRSCTTTDGGVAVSILGVPEEAAPYHYYYKNEEEDWEREFWYFMIDDTYMTILSLKNASRWCWYRPD